jgi:hypothetical protein
MDLEFGYQRTVSRSNIIAVSAGVEYQIFDYDYGAITASWIVGWR